MRDLLPELHQILEKMVCDDPDERLTMAEASKRLEQYRKSVPEETLRTKVYEYCNSKARPYTSSDWRRLEADG
jgi:hypothetical protein